MQYLGLNIIHINYMIHSIRFFLCYKTLPPPLITISSLSVSLPSLLSLFPLPFPSLQLNRTIALFPLVFLRSYWYYFAVIALL
jgi:hypothetical protein